MSWKKKLLAASRLYAIIDKQVARPRSVFALARKIKRNQYQIVQLRDKQASIDKFIQEARVLSELFKKKKVAFIINDDLAVAKIVDADGIHLGQKDLSIRVARKILGKDKIIGVSCHSLAQARQAQANGADYISIGPVFATPTKPEYKPVGLGLLKKVKGKIRIPVFAIGGINHKNLNQVLASGIKRVAACRAVSKGNDSIRIR